MSYHIGGSLASALCGMVRCPWRDILGVLQTRAGELDLGDLQKKANELQVSDLSERALGDVN